MKAVRIHPRARIREPRNEDAPWPTLAARDALVRVDPLSLEELGANQVIDYTAIGFPEKVGDAKR